MRFWIFVNFTINTSNEFIKWEIIRYFEENRIVCKDTLNKCKTQIEEIGVALANTLLNGNTIYWCGNGGSASDSNHLSTELVSRFKKNRKSLSSISLSSDSCLLTCIANDFGYENVFSRQLEGLGKKGDVLVALSTSGNSQNILNVLKIANQMDIKTISLLGKKGGEALNMSDLSIVIPSNKTARQRATSPFRTYILRNDWINFGVVMNLNDLNWRIFIQLHWFWWCFYW